MRANPVSYGFFSLDRTPGWARSGVWSTAAADWLGVSSWFNGTSFEEFVARNSESFPASLGASFERVSSRLSDTARTALRTFVSPDSELDIDLAGSATVNAQFWLNRFPFRPTAGWAILAALLSAGLVWQPLPIEWSALVLVWLLADPLWGSVWRLAGGRTEILPLRERDLDGNVWLPYFEADSPAGRILGQDRQGVLHLLFRVGVPTVAVATGIALALGPAAVWMTAALLVVSTAGWISRHTLGVAPASLHSVVTIVLPWFLALSMLGVDGQHESWRMLAIVVFLWFLHNWGEMRVMRGAPDVAGIVLLGAADIGLALLLIQARLPISLAVLALLWLPTWLAVYRRRPMTRLNFWWLAAMLVSAVAVGQSVAF